MNDGHARQSVASDPASRRLVSRSIAFLWFFLSKFNHMHVSSSAAALSYSSMLAMVPSLALVLASFAAFPALSPLRAKTQMFIINNLVPDTGLQINQALNTFIQAADQLKAFGIIGLGGTAVLLLLTVEGQLNLIFGVTHARPLIFRLLVFAAVVIVCPVLLGLGFSLFGMFSEIPFVAKVDVAAGLRFLLGHIVPSFLTWLVLTFLYRLVPHHQVRWNDAMRGAGIAAILLGVLRYAFASYIGRMTSYKLIYGAVAAVPVLLVWIYFVWFLVMLGAALCAVLPAWRIAQRADPGAAAPA